jgi:hypothetical protein
MTTFQSFLVHWAGDTLFLWSCRNAVCCFTLFLEDLLYS